MSENNPKREGQRYYSKNFGIETCVYSPVEPKSSLPGYAETSPPTAPVAGAGECIASPAVVAQGGNFSADSLALLDSALGLKQIIGKDKKVDFQTIVQAITALGPEMLPILRRLNEQAADNEEIAAVVAFLQEHLVMGEGEKGMVSLAPREMQVLELAAYGKSNADIAEELDLQIVTVAKALSRAYRKLNAKNRTDAVHKWVLLYAPKNT